MSNIFQGTGVAIVTPFDADNQVDYKALKKVINHIIAGGVEYIVALGTTGESVVLNLEDQVNLASFVIETVNKRCKVVVGAGGNDTLKVVSFVEKLNLMDIDGILSVNPYYNRPNQAGIYEHYKAIANNSSAPIILYNVPSRSASNMKAETTLRLAHDFKNIVAIKEASGDYLQFAKILKHKPEHFDLISGDDFHALPVVAMGGIGVISVIGNAYPKEISDLVRAALKGDYELARHINMGLYELTLLAFEEGNPAGIKHMLQELKLLDANLRLPLVPVSEDLAKRIKQEMKVVKNYFA